MRFPVPVLAAILAASPVAATELRDVADLDTGGAAVVLLGEVHDNPHHHENQRAALMALAPSAVVFEMLTPEQADIVNGADRSDAAALETALDWDASGWPDFAMYHPLISATEAPVYGAAVPREDLRAAIGSSAADVFGEGAAAYGLVPLPEDVQAAREALQMEAHCNALPEEMLPGMVEAQRLRDARFSAATLAALDATGGPVAVITGNGHARRDWGMPAYLLAARPGLEVFSLGQFEEGDAEGPATAADQAPGFDAWLVTPAADREDPCAAFTKG